MYINRDIPFVIWIFGDWMKSIAAIEWGKKDDGMYIWPWSFAYRKHFNLNEMLKD